MTRREIIVLDRGWIFAGDAVRSQGRIYLSRVVWVFKWEKIGFNGVIEHPDQADLRAMADIEIPESVEIFSVPVAPDWGLSCIGQ